MNTEPNPGKANSTAMEEAVRQRCLLYLLGELSHEQEAAFEAELQKSVDLQAELISQSEVIAGLSTIQPPAVVAPMAASNWSMRVPMSVAAIAATVMIAILCWPSKQVQRSLVVDATPESLLIAHAWAEEVAAGLSASNLVGDSEIYEESERLDAFAGNGQNEGSSLDWILTAIEAGAISDG